MNRAYLLTFEWSFLRRGRSSRYWEISLLNFWEASHSCCSTGRLQNARQNPATCKGEHWGMIPHQSPHSMMHTMTWGRTLLRNDSTPESMFNSAHNNMSQSGHNCMDHFLWSFFTSCSVPPNVLWHHRHLWILAFLKLTNHLLTFKASVQNRLKIICPSVLSLRTQCALRVLTEDHHLNTASYSSALCWAPLEHPPLVGRSPGQLLPTIPVEIWERKYPRLKVS